MTRNVSRFLALALLLVFVGLGPVLAAQAHGRPGPARYHRVIIVHRPIFYDPWWYDPFWSPRYVPYAVRAVSFYAGEVKFKVEPKGGPKARVYIDDALASEFKHKHTLRLKPGRYEITVRKAGFQSEVRRIHVVAGETLKLEFNLRPAS